MQSADQRINPLPLTFLAAGALAWAVIIATIGAVGPGGALPHIIHSSHTEHFLAFYAIGVLSTAGLPNVRLKWIFLAMAAAAVFAQRAELCSARRQSSRRSASQPCRVKAKRASLSLMAR